MQRAASGMGNPAGDQFTLAKISGVSLQSETVPAETISPTEEEEASGSTTGVGEAGWTAEARAERRSSMDVHRARFVPYPTAAISALAFSRPSDSGYAGALPALKLAVGRANGSVEIWNPLKGSWVQEAVFPGDGKGIDGLAWTQDPDETDLDGNVLLGQHRLFSISSSPAVTEWDLASGQIKRRSTGNFSEVWCFAAQPRWKRTKNAKEGAEEEPRAQDLVVGCGDGTLVLLSTADNDLQFKRYLARVSGKKARCMCITYQNRDIVVAGFADNMIRVYDTRNGSQVRQMSLGVAAPGAPKNALVWQVKALPNGDIASGDSNGEVRIWDGRNYSLLRRLTGHDSDCLDLVSGADGRTIFSGSIDGKMAIYKQATSGGRNSWAKNSHRRVHNGEVKAVAAFDSKAGLSVVVSGGSDMAPMITPLREYGKENLRSLPCLPQEPPVASAPKARLLASWWDQDVYIWRIARPGLDSGPEPPKSWRLVAKLSLSAGQGHIRSASMTADGKLLATATNSEIKVFQLKKRTGSDNLAVRKIDLPKDFGGLGARLLSFSPDGKWLTAVTPDSEVHIARFTTDPSQPKKMTCLSPTVELDRQRRNPLPLSAFKEYDRAISRVAWAFNSSVLVAGDLSGYLDSWVLEGREDPTASPVDRAKHDSDGGSSNAGSEMDSDPDDEDDETVIYYGQHWTDSPNGHLLPQLESAPLVLTFRPSPLSETPSEKAANGNPGVHATRRNPHAHSHELPLGSHRLLAITARHHMYEFDVLAGRLSEWSRRNPSAALPDDFTKIKDRVMGAVWDRRERIWLYGSSWVFMLDVSSDLADGDRPYKKRRRPRHGADGHHDEAGEDDVGGAGARKKWKNLSGAGDRIEGADAGPVRRYEDGRWADADAASRQQPRRRLQPDDEADDDDEDALGGLQLTHTRSHTGGGDDDDEAGGRPNGTGAVGSSGGAVRGARKFWGTFKYRPILGMVPLEDEGSRAADRPLEVAVVERPMRETR